VGVGSSCFLGLPVGLSWSPGSDVGLDLNREGAVSLDDRIKDRSSSLFPGIRLRGFNEAGAEAIGTTRRVATRRAKEREVRGAVDGKLKSQYCEGLEEQVKKQRDGGEK